MATSDPVKTLFWCRILRAPFWILRHPCLPPPAPAAAPRCSCLQHWAHEASTVDLVRRHPAVGFFILVPEAAQAEALVASLSARNATNAYVTASDLRRQGALPLRNGVIKTAHTPGSARSSRLAPWCMHWPLVPTPRPAAAPPAGARC